MTESLTPTTWRSPLGPYPLNSVLYTGIYIYIPGIITAIQWGIPTAPTHGGVHRGNHLPGPYYLLPDALCVIVSKIDFQWLPANVFVP